MNYEQKYKEALERMKSWVRGEHPDCFSEAQKAAEFIFPELKESEDERIRKELIEHIKANKDADYVLFKKFSPDDVIAWLEKQDEKLDPDKVIEWLKTHGNLVPIVTIKINEVIDKFKKDFVLC